jgi:hypothetical protein
MHPFTQDCLLLRQIGFGHSPNCALPGKIDKKFRRHICILRQLPVETAAVFAA